MSTGPRQDTGAPTIEVSIYRNDRLLVRELCESEEAVAVVEQWSDLDQVYVLVDDLSAKHGPAVVLAPEAPSVGGDEDQPLATMPLPEYGTE